MSKPEQITIDIYSDVVCPWCAIGYGQLLQALEQLEGEIEAEVRWRPFELNPEMPKQGEEQEAHLQRKYGRSKEEGAELRSRMKEIAENAGVSLSYQGEGDPPPAMMWNTRDCHKLLAFALDEAGPKIQTDLKLSLFEAHFSFRQDLSDREVLLDIAERVGLFREAAKAALENPILEGRVAHEEREAWEHNITGVPAMILNQKFMVPGAQGPETYVNVLRRVAEKSTGAGSD